MISMSDKLKYNFKNKELLELALTHKSASKNNNERLEFLGDAIINFYVAEKLYEEFEELQEGKLTQLRASLVSRSFLNSLGEKMGLSKKIILGKGESTLNNPITGNVVEAIVGAVFLDSGLESAKNFLDNYYLQEILNLEPSKESRDPKSQLQELLQKKGCKLPTYLAVDHGPVKRDKRFKVTCKLEDLGIKASGIGKNRKIAEQVAAKSALNLLFRDE